MEDESYLVVIEGGSPWGFGIQGGLDFRSPLRVKMVSPGGRAAKSGLIAGDYIVAINGELTKPLKHMEAQQLIKKSKQRVELTCVKLRPGLISPALTTNSSSFSFPTQAQNGGSSPKPSVARSPGISSKPIPRPAPPPVVVNGHPRRSSVGTPSDSTTSSSPHSSCAGDSYEAKFLGMVTYSIDKSHPMPDGEVQECVDVVQVEAEAPIMYDLQGGESSQEVVQEVADVVEVKDEVHASYNLVSMEEPAEADQQNLPAESEQTEEVFDSNDQQTISEPVEAVIMTPKDVDITCDLQGGKSPVVETTEAVMMHATPVEIKCGTESEVKQSLPQRKASPGMNKIDFVNIITHAAERKRRESRGSSTDSEDPTKVQSSPAQVTKAQSPKNIPKQQTSPKTTPSGKSVMSASKPPKPVRAVSIETKEEALPVAMQPLKKTENPVATGNKEPGWYKQMFQDFQNTVEETFPGSSTKSESEYVFDDRGLKVRRNSLPRNTEPPPPPRETAPSPENPVYVIDDRGLRVRAGSLSKVQRSTSPQMEKIKSEQRPKSANTPKLSVDPGVTTSDVLSASKRQTSYKASLYNTEGSKDYWKQKDQDQKEFDEIRRKNSEERHIRQSSGSSDYTNKMSAMHPLLQAGMQDNKEKPKPAEEPETEKVFNRIDASKLQGALENASMLNKLEQEGVSTDLLPGVAKGIQEEKNKPKEKQLKPPPGRKGRALFNFDGHSAKELSFKKGDIIDLLHTVDANWLQGSVGGAKGIFPTTYIKVLSMDEYRELISPEPKPRVETGRAKALYNFQGQSAKELSFSKDDELIIKKKIDDNWYEGYHGDKEGIFPVVYVKEL